jgi:hypothetical protein
MSFLLRRACVYPFFIGFALQVTEAPGEPPKPGAVAIKIEDLNADRVQIIGRTGTPVRHPVTIRGRWRAPHLREKLSNLYFDVTHVDGVAVERAVTLRDYDFHSMTNDGTSGERDGQHWDWIASDDGNLKPPDFHSGDEWEFTGMETMETLLDPGDWDGPIIATNQVPGFDTHFMYFRARQGSTAQQAPTPASKASQ